MKAPTVYDVAQHAGVSIATVSRVFQRPGDVRDATRTKVLASVRELGYVPSASARGLAAKRTGVIGLFFPGFDAAENLNDPEWGSPEAVHVVRDIPDRGDPRPLDLYFDEVLRGAELEAWRRGLVLMMGVGRGSDPDMIARDMAGRVDGLVVLARSVSDEVLEHISKRIPVVLLAGPRSGDEFDHVSVANAEGMRALTAHVIGDRGVLDPVYVAGPEESPDDAERYTGYLQALEDSGIDPASVPLLRADFQRDDARALGERLIAEGALPGALICGNDQMALGILDAFKAGGVNVPYDVLVTGFDGIDAGRLSEPRLTTVRQPMTDLGRVAVHLMADRLEHPDRLPESVRLPVTVLLRESTEV
ncbi:LacI family DNA-binding transcriptional regulator [Leifsonia sp. A12D58]|uniref:LacI family DNA-binding transcriptional regulator n=1 Tax=Leifsonia sp. A12D58 TaxID=3397674 RepID=UPI0039DFC86E